jgi:hypothetical protein
MNSGKAGNINYADIDEPMLRIQSQCQPTSNAAVKRNDPRDIVRERI